MKYRNKAGQINLDCIFYLSEKALDTYQYYNQEIFNGTCFTYDIFDSACKLIDEKHNQILNRNIITFKLDFKPIESNNKVLLAFSGGLDSCYQAFYLKEKGYDVILFHIKNMNYYTNGKEYQVVEEFAKKYNFKLVIGEFKQDTKKDNMFRKYWKENSFKNILLYSMMIDYCICHNISNISSGDDLQLDLKDTVTGTNVADAKQITLTFFEQVYNKIGIKYIPIEKINGVLIHKGERIKKLIEHDALDLFYSCVNPGRFNQSNHNRINKKFGVRMEKWNCGVCRKCAFHSLLMYYYLKKDYPKEFIDFCWIKICNGADYEFFKPDLPMETRIKNLYDY